jgi:hypothetical protein
MGGPAAANASGKKKEGVADPGPTSLFLFTPSSPVRRLTTWFVNWPLFEWTIIITIIANCVVMALDDKLPYGDKTVLSIQMVSLSTFTQPLYNLSIVIIILGTVQKLQ